MPWLLLRPLLPSDPSPPICKWLVVTVAWELQLFTVGLHGRAHTPATEASSTHTAAESATPARAIGFSSLKSITSRKNCFPPASGVTRPSELRNSTPVCGVQYGAQSGRYVPAEATAKH